MDGSLRTVLVRDGMSMGDCKKEMVTKLCLRMPPESKAKIEAELLEYEFFARHQSLKTLSKVP
jgi:hypothetical protein